VLVRADTACELIGFHAEFLCDLEKECLWRLALRPSAIRKYGIMEAPELTLIGGAFARFGSGSGARVNAFEWKLMKLEAHASGQFFAKRVHDFFVKFFAVRAFKIGEDANHDARVFLSQNVVHWHERCHWNFWNANVKLEVFVANLGVQTKRRTNVFGFATGLLEDGCGLRDVLRVFRVDVVAKVGEGRQEFPGLFGRHTLKGHGCRFHDIRFHLELDLRSVAAVRVFTGSTEPLEGWALQKRRQWSTRIFGDEKANAERKHGEGEQGSDDFHGNSLRELGSRTVKEWKVKGER
jgi:hypothetical protein